jgi:MoxR-like ATPase
MAGLRAAMDDTVTGAGRIVMLAGEPGTGKTHMAEELAS